MVATGSVLTLESQQRRRRFTAESRTKRLEDTNSRTGLAGRGGGVAGLQIERRRAGFDPEARRGNLL
jgi:hypothetical protein